MGYRSDIKVAIRKANTELVARFDQVNAKHKSFTRSEAVVYGTELVIYSGEWLKWYEGDYESVDEYMEIVNEDTADLDYIRVGEDDDDIDRIGGNGWIGTETRIVVN